jgi:hypothetical protein
LSGLGGKKGWKKDGSKKHGVEMVNHQDLLFLEIQTSIEISPPLHFLAKLAA